ncbi:(d)CMP kinase [Francisella adeliensis]|uniref:Cytidylate kinase n=1 Tax=Francisella adeliensis TaxID=2007306 RepID=A0A2Z4XZQ1_9GAMM|nr:(d)CMP kinase [Francisella adeliensis]AXA33913.1 cytidylate kinase [Francisella adeliensis]MBK2085819.1 (d)CMP kinase [Francisella adeliensis]MBK2097697.1 (d)CMP kinase [Francisella adeliensis]QIW12150.1 (d)CMP kinase [Francisella adeliensis]QIW14025.1 (d)CMP kinase [Francisella adeliensis]
MNNHKIITIDGPSGVGKGTLAKALAKHFNYKLLDSGAIYRLAALHCLKNNTNLDNETNVCTTLKNLSISFEINNDEVNSLLNGDNVSKEIRTEKTGMSASKIAAYPKVREILFQKQQDFATDEGLVADGRDMGTVVFTNAKYKFFLDADTKITAQRRYKELESKGLNPDFETILADIEKRDYQDRNRKVAPLKPADDAVIINTSHLSIKEVFDKVVSLIK